MESIKKFEEFLTESLSKYDGIDEIQDSFKKHKRTINELDSFITTLKCCKFHTQEDIEVFLSAWFGETVMVNKPEIDRPQDNDFEDDDFDVDNDIKFNIWDLEFTLHCNEKQQYITIKSVDICGSEIDREYLYTKTLKELGFSNRCLGIFNRANLYTVEDLIKYLKSGDRSESIQLHILPGMGTAHYKEAMRILINKGLINKEY